MFRRVSERIGDMIPSARLPTWPAAAYHAGNSPSPPRCRQMTDSAMPAPPDPASPESAVPDPSVPESAGPESVSNPDSDGNGATCEETARLEQLAAATDLLRAVTDGIQQGTGELALQTQLRKDWPAPLVSAALALVEQRQRARRRFSRGDQMWFDRDLLEQATHEEVARYKAARFAGQEGPVWDLCCGAGSDAMAQMAQPINDEGHESCPSSVPMKPPDCRFQ